MRINRLNSIVGCIGFVSVAACGSVAPLTPDANRSPDAQVPAVSVTAYSPQTGLPQSGLPVAFLNADDSVVATTTTDTNGTASAQLAAGGSVTVGAENVLGGSAAQVYTCAGVQPGDNLRIGTLSGDSETISFTVVVDNSNISDVGTFMVSTSCGPSPAKSFASTYTTTDPPSPTTPMMISLPATCTTADIYVLTIDDSQTPSNGIFLAQQPITPNGTLNVTTPFVNLQTTNLSLDNSPTWAANTLVSFAAVDGAVELYSAGTSLTAVANTPVPVPLVPAPGLQYIALVGSGDSLGRTQTIVQRVATQADLAVDLGMGPLPTIEAKGTYDAASSSITWTESGNTGVANAEFIEFNVTQGSTRNFNWNIIAPHTAGAAHVPALPSALSEFALEAADTVNVSSTSIFNASVGYDAIRGSFFNILASPGQLVPNVGDKVLVSSGPN